jgi:hypothetical protein
MSSTRGSDGQGLEAHGSGSVSVKVAVVFEKTEPGEELCANGIIYTVAKVPECWLSHYPRSSRYGRHH